MIFFRDLTGTGREPTVGATWQAEYYSEVSFPVGIAWVYVFPRTTFIAHLLVTDQERRKGIGTALVEACRERWPNLAPLEGTSDAGLALVRHIGIKATVDQDDE